MAATKCFVTYSGIPAEPIDTAVGDPWTTVVSVARTGATIAAAVRLGSGEFDPVHPDDPLADAKRWAVMLGLTTIGPSFWAETPETPVSFSQLYRCLNTTALEVKWYATLVRLDDRSLPGCYLTLPHGAVAVAAATGRGAVALGARGTDLAAVHLHTAPTPVPAAKPRARAQRLEPARLLAG
jgi:hypothetical protein